jgi:hypothetical protein
MSLTCFRKVYSKYFTYNGFLHFINGKIEKSDRINTEGDPNYEEDEIIENYRGASGNDYYPDNFYYTARGNIDS